MDRRTSLRLMLGAAAAAAVRCGSSEGTFAGPRDPALAQLASRPRHAPAAAPATNGPEPLGLVTGGRDGVLFAAPSATGPTPLILLLHGATGSGEHLFERVRPELPQSDVIVVAPDSRGVTWTGRDIAADVTFVDRALALAFARYPIDPRRVFVAGYSDGASSALTLSLTNGDLFSRVVALSPGYLAVQAPSAQRPEVFVAHGTRDDILPIERTGRHVVVELRRAGYHVTFREFDGTHKLQPEIVREAVAWLRA